MTTISANLATESATTSQPPNVDTITVAVVATILSLTLLVAAVFLFRYFCRNKGEYTTAGEEDPGAATMQMTEEEEDASKEEKKEYYI